MGVLRCPYQYRIIIAHGRGICNRNVKIRRAAMEQGRGFADIMKVCCFFDYAIANKVRAL